MNILRKSLISIAVSSALLVAGCSSSSDSESQDPALNDGVNGPVTTGGNTGTPDSPAGGTVTPVGTGSLNLATAYPRLLDALSGYQLETLAEEVMLVGDSISAGSAGALNTLAGSFSVDDRGENTVVPTQIMTYDCDGGGTVSVELGRFNIAESSYSRAVERDRYTFDQCDSTAGGSQQLNGVVSSFADSTSGSRFQRSDNAITWEAFSWNQNSGQQITADASITGNGLSSNDSSSSRTVTINDYSLSRGNRFLSEVSNGRFSEQAETLANGGVHKYALDISGQVTDESGIASSVASQPALSRVWVASGLESGPITPEPFSGEISISADNGSQILLTATEPGDAQARQVDVFHRAADGSTSTLKAQNFQTFGTDQ